MNRKFYRDVWLLLLLISFGVGSARAGNGVEGSLHIQEKTVSGRVVSPEGEALPGVNIER